MKLTEVQELAVQAVISSYVGREEFDSFFLGMKCGPVMDGHVVLFVHNEYYARHILTHYPDVVGHAVSRVARTPITSVSVAPLDIETQVRASMDGFFRDYMKR